MLLNEDFFDNDIDIEVQQSQTEHKDMSFGFVLTIRVLILRDGHEKTVKKFSFAANRMLEECRQVSDFALMNIEQGRSINSNFLYELKYGMDLEINNAKDVHSFLTLFVLGPLKKIENAHIDRPVSIAYSDNPEEFYMFGVEEWAKNGERYCYETNPATMWKYVYLENYKNQENDIYNFCKFILPKKYNNKFWLFLKEVNRNAPFIYTCVNDTKLIQDVETWNRNNDFLSKNIHTVKTGARLSNVSNPNSPQFNKQPYVRYTCVADSEEEWITATLASINDISPFGQNKWIRPYCFEHPFTVYIVDNLKKENGEKTANVYFMYEPTGEQLICLYSSREDSDERKIDMLSCAMPYEEAVSAYKKYSCN